MQTSWLIASLFALAGCSSSGGASPTTPSETSAAADDTAAAGDSSGSTTDKVGDVLPDLDLHGYVRNDTTRVATSVPAKSFKISEALAVGTQRYAFIYDAAWWCSPCKQATQLVIGKLAANAAKAQFIEIVVEGVTPTTPTTSDNLDTWVNALSVPFTSAIDADPSTFTTKKTYGIKETTYIIERTTRMIVAKSAAAVDALTVLDTLP